MTSINTNASATTALRTLQATNKALETTQNRVSTGLKIAEAKDNAAYWSISTALKSDNKSLSTVKDALSLGAATVDTAYQGLSKAKEVLDEIKSKITAATQDGVDRKAIQSEISELQKQLKSIASSSTFSGENWLSVNSGLADYSADKTVVSSLSRDNDGSFSIGTIDIDISKFALIDGNGSGEAILDAGKVGNVVVGGLASQATAAAGTATSGSSTGAAAFAYTPAGATPNQAAETLALNITVDSSTLSFTLTDSTTFDTLDELVTQLNQNLGSRATAVNVAGTLVINSNTTGTASTVNITSAVFTGSGTGPTSSIAGVTAGDTSTIGTATAATFTQVSNFGTNNIVLDDNDSITFQLELNGAAAKTVTVNRDTVTAALGAAANGTITSATEYASVLNKAFQNAGVTTITAGVAGSSIKLDSSVIGATSSIRVASVTPSKGTSILTLDVTTASDVDLANFLNVVNKATNKVTTAASTLGAVAARIDLQSTFVDTLIDTIDKGVSDLIDADLSEESTRLQALQTKQQLGIQALSIANASTQNVLALFQ